MSPLAGKETVMSQSQYIFAPLTDEISNHFVKELIRLKELYN